MEYDVYEYRFITDRNQVPGTDWMEFTPGKCFDPWKCNDSAYTYEDNMYIIQDLFYNANSKYDHYEHTYFNRKQVKVLIDGLSARLSGIKNNKNYKIPEEVYNAEQNSKEIKGNREKVIKFLEDLIAWISANRDSGISVIGV